MANRSAEASIAPPQQPLSCESLKPSSELEDRTAYLDCLASQNAGLRSFAAAAAVDENGNPDLPDSCGIDIALILDKSGSIGGAGIANLKSAANAFTGALVDLGSQVSVVSFDQDAYLLLPATDLTSGNLGTIQGSYAGLVSDGWTNWKRGLEVGLGTFGGFDDTVELTVVITDGNPNTVNPANGGQFPDGSPGALDPAVLEANAIKGTPSHVFVVGVGPSVSTGPIVAISGAEVLAADGSNINTADYMTTTSYATLAEDLRAVATALCGGTVVVHKSVDGVATGGWGFETPTTDVTPAALTTLADGTGIFEVEGYDAQTDVRTVTITEETRPNHGLENLYCELNGEQVPITHDEGSPTWSVDVGKLDIVHCWVENETAKWEVTKTSDPPSGTAVEAGDFIDYTLHIRHLSGPNVTDFDIDDDISQLAPYVSFVGLLTPAPVVSSDWDGTPGKYLLKLAQLTKAETLNIRYRVQVDADVPPGSVLRNVVLTNCPAPAEGEPDLCVTENPTPGWELRKYSNPPSGSVVYPGYEVTYELDAYNFSEAPVIGGIATDDLSDVLDNATIDELGPGLTLEGTTLTWAVPDLEPGDSVSTSYTVIVNDDAWGQTLTNVVTPEYPGSCPPPPQDGEVVVLAEGECTTDHEVADPNLRIQKLWEHDGGDNPVDSGDDPPDVISYAIGVWNSGNAPVENPVVTDTLPEGLTFVPGSEVVPAGWVLDASVPGQVTFSQETPGPFDPIAYPGVIFEFDVEVGELAQPDPTVPIPDLVNTACVAGEIPPQEPLDVPLRALAIAFDEEPPADDPDIDGPLADCDEASTPVKSVALDGAAQCVNDTPWFTYAVTPYNMEAPLPAVALIWWTLDAYENRDPSIDAADEAALLADGASQVDYVVIPPDWAPGDTLAGQQLWPGAEVDAEGNPIDWPGWTLLPDGTWVLDPDAPFYDLRDEAVVEIRVNPSTDVITAYPPPTPNCNAAPPENPGPGPGPNPAGGSGSRIAGTGFAGGWLVPFAVILLMGGALVAGRSWVRRRGLEQD
ncbi:VWA domain-containing protein [Agromyces intestinalis]|uniref:VWA domain-containing protein n=1 Tax=Agromyces intestinalis TaxID=2592652 RepID=A0A5C1YBZ1_9MICO|nr:VWA domain-containing protein [Agromyces intestinalis]